MTKKRPVDVLLVEDEPADADLMREILKDHGDVQLHVVEDGAQALSYLRKEDGYADTKRPHLVFLDLNLPGENGRDILKAIKTDEALRDIPLVVLSTSDDRRDINDCYQLGANSYVTKPTMFTDFSRVMKAIEDFWLDAAKLPG